MPVHFTTVDAGTTAGKLVQLDGSAKLPAVDGSALTNLPIPTGLLSFKGSTDCSANPNYPSASKGDSYMVSVAGKIGGASGVTVEAGDLYIAIADNAGGTQAGVGTSWTAIQSNLVLGTGVATALAIAVGSAGAIVTNGGALGTPSSGTLTSCTGLPISTGISGAGTGILTALAVNTGSAGAPVLFNGALGTPTSGVGTNITSVNAATLGGATFAAPGAIGGGTPSTGAFTTLTATTLNGNTFTTGTYTLTGTAGKTLTFSNTLTLAGTDSTTMTFPSTSATIARKDAAQTFSGTQTFSGSLDGQQISGTIFQATNNVRISTQSGSNGVDLVPTTGWGVQVLGWNDSVWGSLSAADLTCVTGNIIVSTAGKGLTLKSGTGARAGNATLVGGTVTVTNTTVTANTVVLLNIKTTGGTLGTLSYTLSAGASFTINSSSAIDTSTVSYMLIEVN